MTRDRCQRDNADGRRDKHRANPPEFGVWNLEFTQVGGRRGACPTLRTLIRYAHDGHLPALLLA